MPRKVISQILFWFMIFFINLALSPSYRFDSNEIAFEFVCVLFYAFIFYLNIYYLFPTFYENQRVRYFLYSIAVLLLGIFVLHVLNHDGKDHRGGHHRIDMFEVFNVFKQIMWMVLTFFISTIYSIQQRLNQQIVRHKQIMEEKLQTELQLLKAQINPHFLFNALNNIYSLTYMQSEKASDSVLKLSEMLRYVIEDCSEEKVLLKKEIAYINSFIDFYKMKNPGDRNIRFLSQIENNEVRIAPMLFVPFIENSFKYSRIEEDSEGYIYINLVETNGKLSFTLKNTIFSARTILPGSGKGIENVKQRLHILYPDKYTLSIDHKEKEFSVALEIDLL